MNVTKGKYFTLAGLTILIIVTLTLIGARRVRPQASVGSLEIALQVPDTNNIVATLNNKPINFNKLQTNYTLKAENYTLSIKKSGYEDLSAQFTIQAGRPIIINAALQRLPTPKLTNLATVKPPPGVSIQGWAIANATYFYNNTWAFVDARTTGGLGAFFVLQYDDVARTWKVILGPETVFTSEDVQNLPADVQDYLQNNNYVYAGG